MAKILAFDEEARRALERGVVLERTERGTPVCREHVERVPVHAREPTARRDVVEDRGGLGEHAARGQLEGGWGEVRGRADLGRVGEDVYGVLLRVWDAGVLERETDVFAAPRDFRPLLKKRGPCKLLD